MCARREPAGMEHTHPLGSGAALTDLEGQTFPTLRTTMDLWDVVKLIVRRWIVSVPLLLLTAAALVWTASAVQPNYTAEGNILMLPPTTEISTTDGERAVNPWDTDSLTGAVITLLRNKALHDQLVAEGYNATWEAGRDVQFFSVINIEVTAPTTGEAQAAIQRLSEVVSHEVNAHQQGYELTDGQMVGTVTLGAGENVAIARGNQMRALIVVFFAGAIMTVGLTIGYDALLRALADRRTGHRPVSARAAEPAPVLAAETRHTNGARLAPIRQLATADGENHSQQTHPAQQPGISVSYRPASGVAAGRPADEVPHHPSSPGPALDDSTVVLPLSSITPGTDRGDEDPTGGGAAEHRWR
jgi:capsular polysaccharide biosynthesis protein